MATETLRLNLTAQDRMSKVVKGTSSSFDTMARKVAAVAVAYVGFRAATRTASAALKKLNEFSKQSIQLAGVQEVAEVKLAAAMRAAGIYTREAYQANLDMASGFQAITTYGDEAIIALQAVLTNMGGLSGPIMDDAIRATLNLAQTWDMNLSAAGMQIAKAAGGYTSGLTRYGVMLDKTIPASEKFAAALEIINAKMGGAAQAQANTYTGILKSLSDVWGDLGEELGFFLTKSLGVRAFYLTLTETIIGVTGSVKDLREEHQDFVTDIITQGLGSLVRLAGAMDEVSFQAWVMGQGLNELWDKSVSKYAIDQYARFAEWFGEVTGYEEWRQKTAGVDANKDAMESLLRIMYEARGPSRFATAEKELADFVTKYLATLEELRAKEAEEGAAPIMSLETLEPLGFKAGQDAAEAYSTGFIDAKPIPATEMVQYFDMEFVQVMERSVRSLSDTLVDAMFDMRIQFKDVWKQMAKDAMKHFFAKVVLKGVGTLLGLPFLMSEGGIASGAMGDWNMGSIPTAQRGFYVPGPSWDHSDNKLVGMHTGEAAIPREQTQRYFPVVDAMIQEARTGRPAFGGGGGGGAVHNHYYNIQTLDAESYRNAIRHGALQQETQLAIEERYLET